jgi:hypothetical protein
MVRDFHAHPQGIDGIHSFCTHGAGFLLDVNAGEEQSVDIERDVLRALPEHYGRAGGAQRFSRVKRWEGSSKSAFRRVNGCPGVAASSQSPPHTAGLAVGHRGVCRLTCGVRFASGDLPSASNTALLGARQDELPHASCVDKGHRTNCENNAVQVAGLDRICFACRSSWWVIGPRLGLDGVESCTAMSRISSLNVKAHGAFFVGSAGQREEGHRRALDFRLLFANNFHLGPASR